MDSRLVRFGAVLVAFVMASVFVYGPTPASATTTRFELISRTAAGGLADGYSDSPAISSDGRYVVFSTLAALVGDDANGLVDVYLHDRQSGSIERVSVSSTSEDGDSNSMQGQVSDDGRYVSFLSYARNLDTFDEDLCEERDRDDDDEYYIETYNCLDLFVRDRVAGETIRVNVGPSGESANGDVDEYGMSGGGTRFAFHSRATNLVAGDTNGEAWDNNGTDVFVRDITAGSTSRVSVSSSGVQGDRQSLQPDISGDGRYVVFSSAATNLIDGVTKSCCDLYLHDLATGSTSSLGLIGENYSASIDGDGDRIAFSSYAKLLPIDTNPSYNTYVYDVPSGNLQLTDISIDGQTVGAGGNHISISANGNVVSVVGAADRGGPTFGIYLRHLDSGTTEFVAMGQWPQPSTDGSKIAFVSIDSTLVPGDTNGVSDIFVRVISEDTDPRADEDGDGVADVIDVGDGAFDDGAGTTGSIVSTAGHDVLVASDADGVRITVSGSGTDRAEFSVCGFTLRLAPGSEVVVSCGSITVTVVEGSAELVLGDGLILVTVPDGVTARVVANPDGTFQVTHIAGALAIQVRVDGVSTSVGPGASLQLQAWDFVGFGDPVNNGEVLNVVKAGQAVPLKWRLLDANGNPVLDLTGVTVRVSTLPCSAGVGNDPVEEAAAGGSGLRNLGDGYYQLNWKTAKEYARSCRTMSLVIGDGVVHQALFQFTK